MKYDDNHIRDFEGAIGICLVCGLKVTLDRQDKPAKPFADSWVVKCPHCNHPIECYKPKGKVKLGS